MPVVAKYPSVDSNGPAIKVEKDSALVTESEEVYSTKYSAPIRRPYYRGRRLAPNRGSWRGYNNSEYYSNRSVNKNERPINPTGPDGRPITCKSCGSYRHLMAKCPDSWEN